MVVVNVALTFSRRFENGKMHIDSLINPGEKQTFVYDTVFENPESKNK